MKIRLYSDLHYEFMMRDLNILARYVQRNDDNTDVLVLAGDIGVGSSMVVEVAKFFLDLGYPKIVFTPGNHEYYGTTISTFDSNLRAKLEDEGLTDRVFFLNPGCILLDGVLFVGATLWSDFQGDLRAKEYIRCGINDFGNIYRFGVDDCAILSAYHQKTVFGVCDAYPSETKKVVVTHFLPANECIAPRFVGSDPLNKYFANDMAKRIEKLQNAVWMFGHTHDSVDVTIGTTRVVSNPLGYWARELNGRFDPCFVLEV